LPLIHALRQEGMRDRHWNTISNMLNLPVHPSPKFTLTSAIEMGLLSHIDKIQEVSEIASK
jgi:dynein heavy chain